MVIVAKTGGIANDRWYLRHYWIPDMCCAHSGMTGHYTPRHRFDKYAAIVFTASIDIAVGRGMKQSDKDRRAFETAVNMLHAEVANAGAHLTIDSTARMYYVRETDRYAEKMRQAVKSGQLTWAEAAKQAQEERNRLMKLTRNLTTPFSKAIARKIKRDGLTFNGLVGKHTLEIFGKQATFSSLSQGQRNRVYKSIVESAGNPNPKVTATATRWSYYGRRLLFISIALSVYTVATAEDKMNAAAHEAALFGAGVAGGIAGGMVTGSIAGIVCGPGAPICVGVGAFVGGALAALGVEMMW